MQVEFAKSVKNVKEEKTLLKIIDPEVKKKGKQKKLMGKQDSFEFKANNKTQFSMALRSRNKAQFYANSLPDIKNMSEVVEGESTLSYLSKMMDDLGIDTLSEKNSQF